MNLHEVEMLPHVRNILHSKLNLIHQTKYYKMKQKPKICAYCGEEFIPERRHAMYCSSTCRQYSYIKRKTGETPYDRVKRKEEITHQLQSVPALVIDGLEENPVEQNQELSIASIDNRQSASNKSEFEINITSKETINQSTNNTMETINTPSIDDNSSKKSYNDLLEQEKGHLNELLMDWWDSHMGNNREKMKLALENSKAKVFIEQFLKFDGKEIKQMYLKQFLFQLQAYEKNSSSSASDFLYSQWFVGDMRVMGIELLEKMQALKLPSMIFKLTHEQRAEFEVMLQFMNAFNMQIPSYWLLP